MLMKEDVEHLATLARISISEEEKISLPGELDAALHYVGEIGKVATAQEGTPQAGDLRNVLREDNNAYAGGEFTEMILANAPHEKDGYFKVEQIM